MCNCDSISFDNRASKCEHNRVKYKINTPEKADICFVVVVVSECELWRKGQNKLLTVFEVAAVVAIFYGC